MELIPVDRTGDLYTWMDGRTELVKTNQLPNPGPKVSVDFTNENRKTFSLKIDQGKCSGSFSVTVDVKTLLAQLDNRGGGTGGTGRGGVISRGGNVISVGRGSNSVTITDLGSNSAAVTKLLTSNLGMTSADARKAVATLPLTLNGISNANLKKLDTQLTKNRVSFTTK